MIFFQSELMELFPTNYHANKHAEVVKFASGLSEQIGTFLWQYLVPRTMEEESVSGCQQLFRWLRENELFSQDLFPKVPSVKKLHLSDLDLSWAEVQSLSHAIKAGRLPQLKVLVLWNNILTGWLKDLFVGPNHPGFPRLEMLGLEGTHLNSEDVESLSEAVRAGKLPELKELALGKNNLTGCLKDLFGGPHHPRFPSLEKLVLSDTHLSRDDVGSLSEAVRAGKLPELKELDLSENTLTGCLKDLFGGPDHPGFPSLEKLFLNNNHLNQEEVESLSEAVWGGKLPHLKDLNLRHNNLSRMEREVEALMAACDSYCEKRVWLGLWRTQLRQEEFTQRCRDKYCDVEIEWF